MSSSDSSARASACLLRPAARKREHLRRYFFFFCKETHVYTYYTFEGHTRQRDVQTMRDEIRVIRGRRDAGKDFYVFYVFASRRVVHKKKKKKNVGFLSTLREVSTDRDRRKDGF